MTEQWRNVIGYEGWYQVSDMGRVKRIASGQGTRPGRFLKLCLTKWGYQAVGLTQNSKQKTFFVHRVVLEAFVCIRPAGLQVNHKNGDKTDNRLSNLEWVTPRENIRHAMDVLGIRFCGDIDNYHGAKLTPLQVQEIRLLYSTGRYSMYKLARMFKVTRPSIANVIHRRTWKHIP